MDKRVNRVHSSRVSRLLRRTGPFAEGNARLYVLFTVLYNARAYYPILAIFFTDLGLTLDQFVLLNFAWAATIVLFEVPSGALADTLGRKRLLVVASALMVTELGLLLVAPQGGGALLFGLCLVNRILSGASEAAVSGADEAIAYDSLPEGDRERGWDEVLGTAMRWKAFGFLIAMTVGGLLYDPSWLARMGGPSIPVEIAHRLPIALVFCQAVACLVIALRFGETMEPHPGQFGERCRRAFTLTLRTAKRVFTTRSIALVLVAGLLIDAVARNFATINSEYYRLIGIPAWVFGFIGSLVAVGNWFVPAIAVRLNRRFAPLSVLAMAAAALLVGLTLLAPAWPWFGLLPALLLMSLMAFVNFTLSRFLHRAAESHERATMLSVKGLTFNFGYGAYSLGFSLLLAGLRRHSEESFQQALWWQAGLVGLLIIPYFLWARRKSRAAEVSG